MKLIILTAMALFSLNAFASWGRATGCYQIGVVAPTLEENSVVSRELVGITKLSICTTEENVVEGDEDGIKATGDFTIKFKRNHVTIREFKLKVRESDGAAGTIYTTYVFDEKDLGDEFGLKAKFRMRNDKIPRGQLAGFVDLFGESYPLVQIEANE